jgi:acyl-homoserine-lactone acylase
VLNPPNGWIQNTNNWPYSAAGANSRKPADFPRYMDTAGENPRGVHALMVLKDRKDFTVETLRAAAYDPYLTAFAELIPGLVSAWDAAPAGALKDRLAEPVAALRGWDHRGAADSVPTSLAMFWGEEMWRRVEGGEWDEAETRYQRIARTPGAGKLAALDSAVAQLERGFGGWRTPWGEVNRFQRISASIVHPFNDAAPSLPVGFASARWGSLASFGARPYPGTRRWYGTSGNSFVAVVEFGDRVKARAVTAGGESGDPSSPHFNDQAARYATGNLREVYFYPADLKGHIKRSYRPGER